VMEYTEKTKTSFDKCRRARRYTHFAWHRRDSVVTPYGYSVPLKKTDLFRGTGKLASRLGPDPSSFVVAKLHLGGSGPPQALGPSDTTIAIADAEDFQDSGIVRIGSEYVFFGRIDRTANLLLDCDRGYDIDGNNTSVAVEHAVNGTVSVTQISIACTGVDPNNSSYKYYMRNTDEDKDTYQNKEDGENFEYAGLTHSDADDEDTDDVEWIRLEYPYAKNGITYLLGATTSDSGKSVKNNLSWRAQLGTTRGRYDADTPLLPVVQLAGPQCGDEESPKGPDIGADDAFKFFEEVTPVQGDRAEALPLFITHSHCKQYRHSEDGRPEKCHFVFRASFNRPITGDTYSATQGRLLKFPSGEFMSKIPPIISVGGPAGGGFTGAIDELRVSSDGTPESAVLATRFVNDEPSDPPTEPEKTTSAETSLTVMAEMATNGSCTPREGAVPNAPPFTAGGVVMIGDELIWFDSYGSVSGNHIIPFGKEQRTEAKFCPFDNWPNHNPGCRSRMQLRTLDGCVRGILGTDSRVTDHAAGERVTLFEGVPLTVLSGALPVGGDQLSVRSSTLPFPGEGYAIVSDPSELASPGRGEIVGWTRKNAKSTSMTGCQYFRGRYGTSERPHFGGDFCQLLPFRYWDRWNEDFVNDPELAYFQCSYSARDAYWQEIEWKESGYDGGAPTDRIRLRIVCRFDGEPAWYERPTNAQGGLWEFKGGGRQSFRSAGGGPLKADSIEVRVYWEFLAGAWDVDVNDWKRNVRLDNLTVTFGNPLVVRKVDLLDY